MMLNPEFCVTRPAPNQPPVILLWQPQDNRGLAEAMRWIDPDCGVETDEDARVMLASVNEAVEFYIEKNGYPHRILDGAAEDALRVLEQSTKGDWISSLPPLKQLVVTLAAMQDDAEHEE